MQRHRASELHGSDFVDAAATVVRKRILKGYLNRHFLIDLSLRFELENVFVLLWYQLFTFTLFGHASFNHMKNVWV